MEAKRSDSLVWEVPRTVTPKQAGQVVCSFLDVAATGYGKATHYNTQLEQQEAERSVHNSLLNLDRDLYTAFLTIPGVTDRSRQLGMRNLLVNPRNGHRGILTPEVERDVVYQVVNTLPPHRMLKMFDAFRVGSEEAGIRKANNARTRKLIFRTILQSRKLDLWAVKYRSKMCAALTHAWGASKTGILRSILSKEPDTRNAKESKILREEIYRWAPCQTAARLYECVGFILGSDRKEYPYVAIFRRFEAAKKDLSAGKGLPLEVLEGIRSEFHKDIHKDELLKLTKDTMSKGQRMNTQRRAKEAGVEVEMNPLDYDAIRLYIYAYEMGMTEEIGKVLVEKARKAAQGFPAKYNSIGIIVDASASMFGDDQQKLRPMAAALAIKDMLTETAETAYLRCVGGEAKVPHLVHPAGETDISKHLIELIKLAPDAIFIISDGYENAPAGRVGEVVTALEEIGIHAPIYHLNPVMAAEGRNSKVRELAAGKIPTMPVQRPDALGVSFLRQIVESDPQRGINTMLKLALKGA